MSYFSYKLPNRSEDILKKHGNKQIVRLSVVRSPIIDAFRKVLNYVSSNKLDDVMKKLNYDYLYHLWLLFELDDGSKIYTEKNQRIKFAVLDTKKLDKANTDIYDIHMNRHLTINQMWNNTVDSIDESDLFIYDPFARNCQVYVSDLLESNGLLTNQLSQFIMQNLTELSKGVPWMTRFLSKIVTSLAHFYSIFRGDGINSNME